MSKSSSKASKGILENLNDINNTNKSRNLETKNSSIEPTTIKKEKSNTLYRGYRFLPNTVTKLSELKLYCYSDMNLEDIVELAICNLHKQMIKKQE